MNRPLVLYVLLIPSLIVFFSCSHYQPGPGVQGALAPDHPASVPVPSLVDSLLASMTLQEKVGQMLMVKMPGSFISTQSGEYERLKRLIEEVHPGGTIVLQGDVYETAVLLNKLQRMSRLPLLVGADLENGLAMRLRKATAFPPAMALTATGDPEYAYAVGRAIAEEARAAGIQQDYAPVVDVNTNPDNPVINTRAFSDDVATVDTMAGRFIHGLQDGGVIATLKHFPGHGATGEDSHLDLPVVRFPRARLDTVDLAAFRSGINQGAQSVMVGHIAVPALEPTDELPASLSSRVITGVLRSELHFNGLVVTDAMDMAGVRGVAPGRAAVMAVKAGVDMLLMTTGEDAASSALQDAVREGKLTAARIDSSVRKILAAKEQLGLFGNRLVDVDRVSDHVGTEAHWMLAKQIARDAVTIVRNDRSLLPLQPYGKKRILSLVLGDVEEGRTEVNRQSNPMANEPFGSYLAHELHRRHARMETIRLDPGSNVLDFDEALKQSRKSDIVLLSLFVKVRSASGRIGLPDEYKPFLRKLAALRKPVIVVSMGNPYLIGEFPWAQALLCAYSDLEVSDEAVAEALFGEFRVHGKLPVTIPGRFQRGTGLLVGHNRLSEANSIQGGLGSGELANVDSLIAAAIADSAFPAAQLAIVKDSSVIVDRAYGNYTYETGAKPINRSTLFDLASLTKVFATTPAIMKLYDEGKIGLDDTVRKYLPRFTGGLKGTVTIRELLLHRGGLPPFRPFYTLAATPEAVFDSVLATPLVAPPGDTTIYSDLSMIILGKIVERVSGMPLADYVQKEFYRPLGMTHTMFVPPPPLRDNAAPTEFDVVWRKRLIRGTVHDENAAALGGISGHAGLFSTASDLALFMQMLLDGGTAGGKRYLSEKTIDEFIHKKAAGQERWLGWDMKAEHGSSAGDMFPPSSFGHTGFTGTSVWADPGRRVAVIFLTNRVYPTRANMKLMSFRPRLHDTVLTAMRGLPW